MVKNGWFSLHCLPPAQPPAERFGITEREKRLVLTALFLRAQTPGHRCGRKAGETHKAPAKVIDERPALRLFSKNGAQGKHPHTLFATGMVLGWISVLPSNPMFFPCTHAISNPSSSARSSATPSTMATPCARAASKHSCKLQRFCARGIRRHMSVPE